MSLKCKKLTHSLGGRVTVLLLLTVLLGLSLLISLGLGSLRLPPNEVLATLCQRPDGVNYQILCHIRLPRILLGALVGACLAVSGALLQGIMRNPLAAPGIIGVSAGGGLAGIVLMLALPQWSMFLVPAAFCGSLGTAALVYLLAWKGGASPVRLILAGVAVSSMLGALSSTVMLFHAEHVGSILDFSIGSLSARSWPQLKMVGPYMAAGLAAALLLSRKLNVLALGDEVAIGLGVRVELVRFTLIAIAALLAAAAVSVAGLLGFVGLIAPHMVRMVIGSDQRFLLPGAALFGAILVTACDTVGRMALEPRELPVGIIMALLGPPFFLYLLRRRQYEA